MRFLSGELALKLVTILSIDRYAGRNLFMTARAFEKLVNTFLE